MTLRPFELADYNLLSSWITDAEILFRFSGPEWVYPLTYTALEDYLINNPERQLYLGYDADIPVAIGEVINDGAPTPRIGRLLIGDPGNRGKGMGGRLIKALLAKCSEQFGPVPVYLYVLASNTPAISCYQKLGFQLDPAVKATLKHNGIAHPLMLMSLQSI